MKKIFLILITIFSFRVHGESNLEDNLLFFFSCADESIISNDLFINDNFECLRPFFATSKSLLDFSQESALIVSRINISIHNKALKNEDNSLFDTQVCYLNTIYERISAIDAVINQYMIDLFFEICIEHKDELRELDRNDLQEIIKPHVERMKELNISLGLDHYIYENKRLAKKIKIDIDADEIEEHSSELNRLSFRKYTSGYKVNPKIKEGFLNFALGRGIYLK